MPSTTQKLITLALLSGLSLNCLAKAEQIPSIGDSTSNNAHIQASKWDMKMIYQPSKAVLERERKGHINIYDGFKDRDVDSILNDNFDRIENMMFTRVKITDDQGQVLIDPQTGAEIVAEDGCED